MCVFGLFFFFFFIFASVLHSPLFFRSLPLVVVVAVFFFFLSSFHFYIQSVYAKMFNGKRLRLPNEGKDVQPMLCALQYMIFVFGFWFFFFTLLYAKIILF